RPGASSQREGSSHERGQRRRRHPERRRAVPRGVAEAAVGALHAAEVAEGGGGWLRARGEKRLDRPRRRLDVRAGAGLKLEAAVALLPPAQVGERPGDRLPADAGGGERLDRGGRVVVVGRAVGIPREASAACLRAPEEANG